MNNLKLYWQGLFYALGVIVYVVIVALVMNNGNKWFGREDTVLTVAAVLSLLCLSAAIVGSLIFGRPAYLVVTGQKSEGIKLFFWTLGFLSALVIITLVSLTLFSGSKYY